MRIQVFAICYNEEVMLPYFLRHYSRFCEKITIYDNYSTDRSVEICRQNPIVEVLQYDSGNQIRDDIYLQIKNNCWKGCGADWVIVCDIDEIVNRSVNVDYFSRVRAGDYTIVSPDWWEMVSDKLPASDGQIYDEINQGISLGQATKCIMFRPDAVKEINYHPGAHGVNAVGDIRILRTSEMKILHYKYLSLQYVIDKYALYRSRLSDINKKNSWGYHYNFNVEKITAYYNELHAKKVNL